MNALVIDDAIVMRNIHKNTLKEFGFTDENIFEAVDGAQALNVAVEQNIDLFLVDWNIPKLDGLEFVKSIRALPKYSKTPIIMITAEAAKYNVIEAIEAGVTNYVVKPIKDKILREKLEKYILK
jgi:two-component system chemotaxis response regulator CheY